MILKEFSHFTRDKKRSRKDRIKQPSNKEGRHGAACTKLSSKIKLKKRIATRRKARKTIAADVAFLYTSCYLRYAEHINLWSAL